MPRDRNAIVIIGQPGSGKSTAVTQFRALGWRICSQGTEGDHVAFEQRAWECLSRGERVVIDRTDMPADQRAMLISLIGAASKQAISVAALYCEAPLDDCVAQLSGPTAEQEVCPLAEELQPPTDVEGFSCALKYVPTQEQGKTANYVEITHGPDFSWARNIEAALSLPVSQESQSDFSDDVDFRETTTGLSAGVLGSIVSKMECVYTTEFRGTMAARSRSSPGLSSEKGDNIASRFVRPAARAMLESGHYLATVKIHGRCCKWEDGKCYRRLDVNLGSSAKGNTRKPRLKKNEQKLMNEFIAATSEHLGVDLTRCWQAGFARGWSWRDSIARHWGWIASVSDNGWRPSAAPDRHGHWIGYTPVRHRCSDSGRILPVDHDADVRHGFDEERGVAFCLRWPELVNARASEGCQRLELMELSIQDMLDGSYELIGPNDAHGGPYSRRLPDSTEDDDYNAVRKFPGWKGDRNERYYFVRHGSVQWVSAQEGGVPPPSPLDQDALRAWMREAQVEGIVWHGTGPFQGRMFKCHLGHLGITRSKKFAFRCGQHLFTDGRRFNTPKPAVSTDSSAEPELSLLATPPAGPVHVGAPVRIRLCRNSDRNDIRVVVVQRGVKELMMTVRNKWRKVRITKLCVEDDAASEEVTADVVSRVADGALIVAY